jgi:hypothetical protein
MMIIRFAAAAVLMLAAQTVESTAAGGRDNGSYGGNRGTYRPVNRCVVTKKYVQVCSRGPRSFNRNCRWELRDGPVRC